MPIEGIKSYQSGDRWYHYDRVTGVRIQASIGTEGFLAEVQALRDGTSPLSPLAHGTLGAIIDRYHDSDDWKVLRPKTRASYERAFDVMEPLRGEHLAKMTRPSILRLRNEAWLPTKGKWLANYTVTVLGILCGFAVDEGTIDVDKNPLGRKVRKLRMSADERHENRPWTPAECRAVLDHAPAQILVPVALAMFSGLRKADVLSVTFAAVVGGDITVRTGKTGAQVRMPMHKELVAAIARRPKVPVGKPAAVQIAVNSTGDPWSETGFNASWRTFKKRIEKDGLVAPGLTIHGLRHTLGTRLEEAGVPRDTIAKILGQKSAAMTRLYTQHAQLDKRSKATVLSLAVAGKKGAKKA